VPRAVAQTLGVREVPGKPILDVLCTQVQGREALLVLDNCEHLLAACAGVADAILRAGAKLTIMATSREPLGLPGEQRYSLPVLSLPEPRATAETTARAEAVQLFVARAQKQQPDFILDAVRSPLVAQICIRLDGIPLGLELAAARVRSLSLEQIHARLDDRFRLLTGGARTAPPRQQTLRATLDWSYDLLHESEKLLLMRLSVFAGGWTLPAAEQVCAGDGVQGQEVLNLLASLCDKSLVMVERDDGIYRYRLLETVRQYARERLVERGGGEHVRTRHRDYFLALAEEAYLQHSSRELATWLQRLEQEHDNLRSALEWALVAAGAADGLRLCGVLGIFWRTRGHLSEGREWCARALGKPGAEERTPDRRLALNSAGALAHFQTDYRAAEAFAREDLAIVRELGDRSGVAASLNNLGAVARAQGDFVAARTLLEESLAIERDLGHRENMARSLNNLGRVARSQGDYAVARSLLEEALAIKRELDDPGGVALTLVNLAHVACEVGDLARADELYKASLPIQREARNKYLLASTLWGMGEVVAALWSPLDAARIWGTAERLGEEIESPIAPDERARYDRCVAAARTAAGNDAVFDRAWQDGRALTLEQAIEFTLEK
jgi:predicted ATPase